MSFRLRPSLLFLTIAVVCAAVIGGLTWWRLSQEDSITELLERLPAGDAPVLHIDVAALRDSGALELLAGSAAEEESDYRDFVRQSGFNYRSDLDLVLACFQADGDNFFLLRGRFSWRQLNDYVRDQGGECNNGVCHVRASTPGRHISFFALTPSTMALASSDSEWEVFSLQLRHRELTPEDHPQDPIWLSIPGPTLARANWLPAGTRAFASALSSAEGIVLAATPEDLDFSVRLMVDCTSPDAAQKLAGELERITALLTTLIRREEKTPNPNDLSGILTAGSFEQNGSIVEGRWPVPRSFLESFASTD